MNLTTHEVTQELEKYVHRKARKKYKRTSSCVREYHKDATIHDISDIVLSVLSNTTFIASHTFVSFDKALEWSKQNSFNQKCILYAWEGYGQPNRSACYKKQMEYWKEDHRFTKFGRSTNLKSRFYDYRKKFSEAVQTVTLWVF